MSAMPDFEEPQISRRIAMVAHDNKKAAVATNVATADMIISSPLMTSGYLPVRPDIGRPSTGAEYLASTRP